MKSLDLHSCELGSFRSRKDKSLSFSVETAEMTPEATTALFGYHGTAARVVIYPQSAAADEMIEVKTSKDRKTSSQRLRGVLFLLHQNNQIKEPFQEWYEKEMEKLIEAVKRELP